MPVWHAPASRTDCCRHTQQPTAAVPAIHWNVACPPYHLQAQLESLQRQVAIMERQAAKAAADKAAAEAKEASR